jgi:pyruvate formate lyase activating enzyme
MTSQLKKLLHSYSEKGCLYSTLENEAVQCFACAHQCKINPNKEGVCLVRFNKNGELFVPKGYVNSIAIDPIEKKPFFHVLPGKPALSFGMLGCNFHCDFCQNWFASQTLRDPKATSNIQKVNTKKIVEFAREQNSPVIVSTYNEPLITSEWAVDIFKIAKPFGIRGAFVSNGHATEKALDYVRPYVDFFKIDLKCFTEVGYKYLGGNLKSVLETIRLAKEKGFWVEIVTLIVPEFNDSEAELKNIAKFLVSVSPDIPWHVTAFHQDYKRANTGNTSAETLVKAVKIGKKAGLNYVYTGNLPGQTEDYENTYCHECGALLIARDGFDVAKITIQNGCCPVCNAKIPGVWE